MKKITLKWLKFELLISTIFFIISLINDTSIAKISSNRIIQWNLTISHTFSYMFLVFKKSLEKLKPIKYEK